VSATAKTVGFWIAIAVTAILLWQATLQPGRLAIGLVQIAIGLLALLGAAWPAITQRRMQLRLLFLRTYVVPMPLQVAVQVLCGVIAVGFWWRAAADLMRGK